jgi:hypothetical protein
MRLSDVTNLTASGGMLAVMTVNDPASMIEAAAKLVVALALLVSAISSLKRPNKPKEMRDDD